METQATYNYDREEVKSSIIKDLFGNGYSTRALLEFNSRYMGMGPSFSEKITNIVDKGVRSELHLSEVDQAVDQFMNLYNHFRFIKLNKEYKKYGMLVFRTIPWSEIPMDIQKWFYELLDVSLETRLDILEGKTSWKDYE